MPTLGGENGSIAPHSSTAELVATHVPSDFGEHEFRIHLITVPKEQGRLFNGD